MKKIKRILKITGMLICACGIVWFLLPIQKSGFGIGCVFGITICLMGMALLLFYRRIAEKGSWLKALARFTLISYLFCLIWCGYLTGLMFSAQSKLPPENTNIILLGAQVHASGRMSISLSGRVGKAYEYLRNNPNAFCIATGGQGPDEPYSEASAEKDALVERGIDEDRIFLENTSHNTRENMENARTVAYENDLGSTFAIVTQWFHMFRSLKLAESAGIEAYSLPADTDPVLFPAYYGRELLSLTKWHVEILFTEKDV